MNHSYKTIRYEVFAQYFDDINLLFVIFFSSIFIKKEEEPIESTSTEDINDNPWRRHTFSLTDGDPIDRQGKHIWANG